jgi:hypothetical protein
MEATNSHMQMDKSQMDKSQMDKSQMDKSQMDIIAPVKLDILNLRDERQRINYMLAFDSLKTRDITKNINANALKRVSSWLNMTEQDILNKIETDVDPAFGKIVAMQISINASRQGTRDEELQIETCNITSKKMGINIEKLNTTDFRPTKTGEIITNKQFKDQGYSKNDCLKSFDAKLTGKKTGWVFAKVVIGNGGHQDNVFEEAHTFCDWVISYGNKSELFIVVCDTNLTSKYNELKEKYKHIDNILIGDHISVQQYFIDNYSE